MQFKDLDIGAIFMLRDKMYGDHFGPTTYKKISERQYLDSWGDKYIMKRVNTLVEASNEC